MQCEYIYAILHMCIGKTACIYQLQSLDFTHHMRVYNVCVHRNMYVCVFGIFLVAGSSSGSNMLECCHCQLHYIRFSAAFLLFATIHNVIFIVLLLVALGIFYALSSFCVFVNHFHVSNFAFSIAVYCFKYFSLFCLRKISKID